MTTERPQATLGTEGASQTRRLRRRTSDRVIGGVAGGVGEYLNIDPLLLRVGFAGLMIFGGAGLVLYVAAWLWIPAQGRDDSIAEDLLARLSRRLGSIGMAIVVLIGVVLVGSYLNRYGAWFTGDAPFVTRDAVVLAVAVIVGGIVILRWREGPRGVRPAGATFGPIAPDAAPQTVPHVPTSWASGDASMPVAEPQPRVRSPLGWYVLAAMLGAVGVLAIIGNLPGLAVALGQYFGAALAVLGIGLIVGAWWGRARLLILLGLLLLPAAMTAAFINVPLNGGLAEQEIRPQTVGELRSDYRLAGGEIQLDLTALQGDGAPIPIVASVGVGVLRVTVPADAQIELDARVGGGRLSLFGNQQTGTGLGDRVERLNGRGPHLVLTLQAGIGAVIVETEAANGG